MRGQVFIEKKAARLSTNRRLPAQPFNQGRTGVVPTKFRNQTPAARSGKQVANFTLSSALLITQGREKQWRPCQLRPQPLIEAADWVQTHRQLWEQRFDRLEDYLDELQREKK
jgi:hypothetical protein